MHQPFLASAPLPAVVTAAPDPFSGGPFTNFRIWKDAATDRLFVGWRLTIHQDDFAAITNFEVSLQAQVGSGWTDVAGSPIQWDEKEYDSKTQTTGSNIFNYDYKVPSDVAVAPGSYRAFLKISYRATHWNSPAAATASFQFGAVTKSLYVVTNLKMERCYAKLCVSWSMPTHLVKSGNIKFFRVDTIQGPNGLSMNSNMDFSNYNTLVGAPTNPGVLVEEGDDVSKFRAAITPSGGHTIVCGSATYKTEMEVYLRNGEQQEAGGPRALWGANGQPMAACKK